MKRYLINDEEDLRQSRKLNTGSFETLNNIFQGTNNAIFQMRRFVSQCGLDFLENYLNAHITFEQGIRSLEDFEKMAVSYCYQEHIFPRHCGVYVHKEIFQVCSKFVKKIRNLCYNKQKTSALGKIDKYYALAETLTRIYFLLLLNMNAVREYRFDFTFFEKILHIFAYSRILKVDNVDPNFHHCRDLNRHVLLYVFNLLMTKLNIPSLRFQEGKFQEIPNSHIKISSLSSDLHEYFKKGVASHHSFFEIPGIEHIAQILLKNQPKENAWFMLIQLFFVTNSKLFVNKELKKFVNFRSYCSLLINFFHNIFEHDCESSHLMKKYLNKWNLNFYEFFINWNWPRLLTSTDCEQVLYLTCEVFFYIKNENKNQQSTKFTKEANGLMRGIQQAISKLTQIKNRHRINKAFTDEATLQLVNFVLIRVFIPYIDYKSVNFYEMIENEHFCLFELFDNLISLENWGDVKKVVWEKKIVWLFLDFKTGKFVRTRKNCPNLWAKVVRFLTDKLVDEEGMRHYISSVNHICEKVPGNRMVIKNSEVADAIIMKDYQVSDFQKKVLSSLIENFVKFLLRLISETYCKNTKISHKSLFSLDYWKDYITIIVSTYPIFIEFLSGYKFPVAEILSHSPLPEVRQNILNVSKQIEEIDFIDLLIALLPFAKSRNLVSIIVAFYKYDIRVQQKESRYVFERNTLPLHCFTRVKALVYEELSSKAYLQTIDSIMKIGIYIPFLTRIVQICFELEKSILFGLHKELLDLFITIIDKTKESQMIILEIINLYDFFSEIIQSNFLNSLHYKYELNFSGNHDFIFEYANRYFEKLYYSDDEKIDGKEAKGDEKNEECSPFLISNKKFKKSAASRKNNASPSGRKSLHELKNFKFQDFKLAVRKARNFNHSSWKIDVPIKLMTCTLEKFSILSNEYPELIESTFDDQTKVLWNKNTLKVFRFPTYQPSVPLRKIEKIPEYIEVDPNKDDGGRLTVISDCSDNEDKLLSDESESVSSRYSSSSRSSTSMSKLVKRKVHSGVTSESQSFNVAETLSYSSIDMEITDDHNNYKREEIQVIKFGLENDEVEDKCIQNENSDEKENSEKKRSLNNIDFFEESMDYDLDLEVREINEGKIEEEEEEEMEGTAVDQEDNDQGELQEALNKKESLADKQFQLWEEKLRLEMLVAQSKQSTNHIPNLHQYENFNLLEKLLKNETDFKEGRDIDLGRAQELITEVTEEEKRGIFFYLDQQILKVLLERERMASMENRLSKKHQESISNNKRDRQKYVDFVNEIKGVKKAESSLKLGFKSKSTKYEDIFLKTEVLSKEVVVLNAEYLRKIIRSLFKLKAQKALRNSLKSYRPSVLKSLFTLCLNPENAFLIIGSLIKKLKKIITVLEQNTKESKTEKTAKKKIHSSTQKDSQDYERDEVKLILEICGQFFNMLLSKGRFFCAPFLYNPKENFNKNFSLFRLFLQIRSAIHNKASPEFDIFLKTYLDFYRKEENKDEYLNSKDKAEWYNIMKDFKNKIIQICVKFNKQRDIYNYELPSQSNKFDGAESSKVLQVTEGREISCPSLKDEQAIKKINELNIETKKTQEKRRNQSPELLEEIFQGFWLNTELTRAKRKSSDPKPSSTPFSSVHENRQKVTSNVSHNKSHAGFQFSNEDPSSLKWVFSTNLFKFLPEKKDILPKLFLYEVDNLISPFEPTLAFLDFSNYEDINIEEYKRASLIFENLIEYLKEFYEVIKEECINFDEAELQELCSELYKQNKSEEEIFNILYKKVDEAIGIIVKSVFSYLNETKRFPKFLLACAKKLSMIAPIHFKNIKQRAEFHQLITSAGKFLVYWNYTWFFPQKQAHLELEDYLINYNRIDSRKKDFENYLQESILQMSKGVEIQPESPEADLLDQAMKLTYYFNEELLDMIFQRFSEFEARDCILFAFLSNSNSYPVDLSKRKADFIREIYRNKILAGDAEPFKSWTIDRSRVWDSTLKYLSKLTPTELAKVTLEINFTKEEGLDSGGLKREWLTLLSQTLFNPENGLFTQSVSNGDYQPSWNSVIIPEYNNIYRHIGRLLGKAILNSDFDFNVNLTQNLIRFLLGKTLQFSDFKNLDPMLYNSLLWIFQADQNILSEMGITFSYNLEICGVIKTVELIEGGVNVSVNNINKLEYIMRRAYARIILEIEDQVHALREGLWETVPKMLLNLLNEGDLMAIIGAPPLKASELKQVCIYEGYTESSNVIVWLWEILDGFDENLLKSFLFFISGSMKLPSRGNIGEYLKITKKLTNTVNNTSMLPIAHTCGKTLDIPEYDSKETLRIKLYKAITEGSNGFFIN